MKTSFNWMLFVILGRTLAETTREEDIRAGISRAYYGLYNRIRIYEGLTTKYRPHQELFDKLNKADNFDEEPRLAGLLKKLKSFREEVDYDGITKVDEAYAREFWRNLHEALELFERNTREDIP